MIYVYDSQSKKSLALFLATTLVNPNDEGEAYMTRIRMLESGKWYYVEMEYASNDEVEPHFEPAWENDVPGAKPPQGPFTSSLNAYVVGVFDIFGKGA